MRQRGRRAGSPPPNSSRGLAGLKDNLMLQTALNQAKLDALKTSALKMLVTYRHQSDQSIAHE